MDSGDEPNYSISASHCDVMENLTDHIKQASRPTNSWGPFPVLLTAVSIRSQATSNPKTLSLQPRSITNTSSLHSPAAVHFHCQAYSPLSWCFRRLPSHQQWPGSKDPRASARAGMCNTCLLSTIASLHSHRKQKIEHKKCMHTISASSNYLSTIKSIFAT